MTELLLQSLAWASRRPAKNGYKHAAFATFTAADLEATLTVPPGHYAAAYQFVLTATGQDTEPVAIPVPGLVTLQLHKAA